MGEHATWHKDAARQVDDALGLPRDVQTSLAIESYAQSSAEVSAADVHPSTQNSLCPWCLSELQSHPSAHWMSTATLPVPPAGWREVDPAVGEPISRSCLLLSKAPLSPTRWRLTKDGPAAFSPAVLANTQAAAGRRVAVTVEVSVRTAAEREAGAMQIQAGHSSFFEPSELSGTRVMHFRADLASQAAVGGTIDPTKAPCPIEASSIAAFITLLKGLVAACDAEQKQLNDTADAAAASSSSTGLTPCIYLHDLYGFNLPGFLVACYLIEECGMDCMSACNDVADSRPPGIYIASLFQALVNRYFAAEQMQG